MLFALGVTSLDAIAALDERPKARFGSSNTANDNDDDDDDDAGDDFGAGLARPRGKRSLSQLVGELERTIFDYYYYYFVNIARMWCFYLIFFLFYFR